MWRLAAIFLAGAALAQAPSFQPVASVSELMISIVYPTSDTLFYIERSPPKTDVEWNLVRNQALTLAESGNLLMMPSRAKDQAGWMKDAKLLVDAGSAAYKAAQAKDMTAILALNDQLYTACTRCHADYRPGYGERRAK